MELNDKEMMVNQASWPNWPLLPIKRYNKNQESMRNFPECAILIGSMPAKQQPVVVFANMFAFAEMSYEEILKIKKQEYESVDALLADGWAVD